MKVVSRSAHSNADAAGMTMMRKPRLGFLGVGWIGRHRMESIVRSGVADVAALADSSDAAAASALECAPGAERVDSLNDLLALDLNGIVIATPSALHAEQALAALERGVAVFCQKPLGRTEEECRSIVEAARASDRLLGVDLSYRHTEGMRRIRDLVGAGEIGRVYAVDLVFHNAYGPDKPWCYDVTLSGGGCVMDLGIHLVDLALWTLGVQDVAEVVSHLYSHGRPLHEGSRTVEDYAAATLLLEGDGAGDASRSVVVRLACSWNLPAGRDAVIEAAFYGSEGGAVMRNLDGSFYDFVAERLRGPKTEVLAAPPDEWGGRAAVEWAKRLARSNAFDAEIESVVKVTAVLDRIYGR